MSGQTFIFYDFETSSRELLGQILSYAFVVVDLNFNILDECVGSIRLNRTQVPDIDAILVNRLSLKTLQDSAPSEYEAAHLINRFLTQCVQTYPSCTLVGFNSNRFDLNFLRNLFIRYGINPYFSGRLSNRDILHFVQSCAFQFSDRFPWSLKETADTAYYSFTLEATATAFGVLETTQSHGARDDVILTIELVKVLESTYSISFSDFEPIDVSPFQTIKKQFKCAKQRVSHYPKGEESPQYYRYRYWLQLTETRKDRLLIDLEKYKALSEPNDRQQGLSCITYVNPNKHFLVLEPFVADDSLQWESVIQSVQQNDFLATLSRDVYFQLTEKDWDIDYQIHALGFERIDALHYLVERLLADPNSYGDIVTELRPKITNQKDRYLLQLFNRVYLNYHPEPELKHSLRYVLPRYMTGELYRDVAQFVSFEEAMNRLYQDSFSEEDLGLISELKSYYTTFYQTYLKGQSTFEFSVLETVSK